MFSLKKAADPQLDMDNASKILEKIFEANQMAPNTVSLDVLTSYSNYRRERFALQRSVLVFMMVLFLLLPFLFIAPYFSIDVKTNSSGMNPAYKIGVDTFMPVERVTASIDDHNIPVYEVDTHVYSIEPSMNGKMKITVTLVNRQTITQYVGVENVDLDAPVVVSNSVDEKHLYLQVSDSGSGINYDKIRAVSLSGTEVSPVSYDEAAGQIVFAYPDESLNVYISDNADNTLQLILTVQ